MQNTAHHPHKHRITAFIASLFPNPSSISPSHTCSVQVCLSSSDPIASMSSHHSPPSHSGFANPFTSTTSILLSLIFISALILLLISIYATCATSRKEHQRYKLANNHFCLRSRKTGRDLEEGSGASPSPQES